MTACGEEACLVWSKTLYQCKHDTAINCRACGRAWVGEAACLWAQHARGDPVRSPGPSAVVKLLKKELEAVGAGRDLM